MSCLYINKPYIFLTFPFIRSSGESLLFFMITLRSSYLSIYIAHALPKGGHSRSISSFPCSGSLFLDLSPFQVPVEYNFLFYYPSGAFLYPFKIFSDFSSVPYMNSYFLILFLCVCLCLWWGVMDKE